ncbi:MAG: restriction endonuclease [gamma proteobacterium symbiont of Stewartia floridana]|nr:MAG: restriction endonuclease [gamma proteobacterium symbiont of Stewartia floridana]
MYLASELIIKAYNGLIELDTSEGKSRKEKISGLRHLIATSKLLSENGGTEVDLSVGSPSRERFVEAVGEVVSLGDSGLYTKDFARELDQKDDYGVGSNFYTTRLAASRSRDIRYPGRPANGHLLFLRQEHASILSDISETLSSAYDIDNIKIQLCVWLLRAEDFGAQEETITTEAFRTLVKDKLTEKYTDDIVNSIVPGESETSAFLSDAGSVLFASTPPDLSALTESPTEEDDTSRYVSTVLTNDLDDEDPVFKAVQQLLDRGSKGILFSGPPGTSKTWYALKVAVKIIDGDEERLERVQFHPAFNYEDFIEGLVSTGSPTGSEPLFSPRDKVFLNLCDRARENLEEPYILIIDEFSRGDPSKIFGELLTYIEPDYREISFRLPYSEKKTTIPQNVLIFATMNPYDKSVSDLDSAMERRFEVLELGPSIDILKDLLNQSGVNGERLGKVISFFKTANRLSPHGFGHTYFKGVKEEIDFILLWNHKLKFIFEKMFRFEEDAYADVRNAYLGIISEAQKESIA